MVHKELYQQHFNLIGYGAGLQYKDKTGIILIQIEVYLAQTIIILK